MRAFRWIAAAGIMWWLVTQGPAWLERFGRPALHVGDEVTITAEERPGVAGADRATSVLLLADAAAYEAFVKASAANDTPGFRELVLTGRAASVAIGTRVRVLERGTMAGQAVVRVRKVQDPGLELFLPSDAGWLPERWVQPVAAPPANPR